MGRRRIWRWVALLWSLRMIAVLIVRSQNSDRSPMDARTAPTSSPRRLWSWWQRLDALDDDEDPGGCWMPTRRVGISSLPGAPTEILISLPPLWSRQLEPFLLIGSLASYWQHSLYFSNKQVGNKTVYLRQKTYGWSGQCHSRSETKENPPSNDRVASAWVDGSSLAIGGRSRGQWSPDPHDLHRIITAANPPNRC